MSMLLDTAIFLGIALFAAISGINDGGNLMSTFLASGSIRPNWFLLLLIVSTAIGPVVFGTAVSHTIAVEVVDFQAAGPIVLLVSVVAALFTLLVTWWLKIPTSTTIALGGGMVGSTAISGHAALIHWAGVVKLMLGLGGSVIVGFFMACVVTRVMWFILSRLTMRQVAWLKPGQYFTAFWQGVAYGANDQEKIIGLLTLFWMMVHHQSQYHVPPVVVLLALMFWTIGLLFGSFRIARTVGQHIVHLDAMKALSTQLSAAATVSVAAISGFPVSTTQTTDGALFGIGTMLHPLGVRWTTVRKMVGVWAMTMPMAILLGVVLMEGMTWLK